MLKKKLQEKKGFTIIEMMIAIALFMIVITIGMGALLNASFIHKKQSDTRSLFDSLSFIMDDMSKNLRTGYTYHCIGSSANIESPENGTDCRGIAFEPSQGDPMNPDDQWVYLIDLSSGNIYKSITGADGLSPLPSPLNPDGVTFTLGSGFTVSGAESNDTQPFVTIKLVGQIITKGQPLPFSAETSVSQRLLNKSS